MIWKPHREPCGELSDNNLEAETVCLVYVLPDDVELERLEASGDVRIAWAVPSPVPV